MVAENLSRREYIDVDKIARSVCTASGRKGDEERYDLLLRHKQHEHEDTDGTKTNETQTRATYKQTTNEQKQTRCRSLGANTDNYAHMRRTSRLRPVSFVRRDAVR